jgi:hypothetical protein
MDTFGRGTTGEAGEEGHTTHVDGINLVSLCIHLINDMSSLKCDCLLSASAPSYSHLVLQLLIHDKLHLAYQRGAGQRGRKEDGEKGTYLEGDIEFPSEIIDTIIKCQTSDHSLHL